MQCKINSNQSVVFYVFKNVFFKILDCLRGIEYAIKLKWFNVRDFKYRDYEYYERIENGDLNLVVPDKFVAFSGPSSS